MHDYRLNDNSPVYRTSQYKNELKNEIARDHPRARDMYELIRRNTAYREKLGHAYNNRCAYCCLPIECVSCDMFEIDHIVSKDAEKQGLASAPTGLNSIENLAFSCSTCNRKKDGFAFGSRYFDLLSPDESLGSTYTRSNDYRIDIAPDYAEDEVVKEFYKRMHFGSDLRRVDYLIASLLDLRRYVESKQPHGKKSREICVQLDAAIGAMVPKRNAASRSLIMLPNDHQTS